MFHSLKLKVKTKDPIRLSNKFKQLFTYNLIQNNDDGGIFEFQSKIFPEHYFSQKDLKEEFKQQLAEFVPNFEILCEEDLVCIDPYLMLTIDIYSIPDEAILNERIRTKLIKRVHKILNEQFQFAFIRKGFVVEPKTYPKSNTGGSPGNPDPST